MPIDLMCEVEGCPDGLDAFLNRVADVCFELEGIQNAGFSVRIVDDATIRALNREMRHIDSTTDVLSFPTVRYPAGTTARDNPKRLKREYDPSLDYINLGDCVLNLHRAQEQAEEFGHSLKRELGYLTAHSAFHLMGYDHMTDSDKAVMRGMEKRAMQQLELWRNPKGDSMNYDALFAAAKAARENAYAPYSKFMVGACILTESGSTYTGCNFENASFGATICAERCAASCAVSNGERKFAAIAIVGNTPAWPCGICRQVLREFAAAPDMPVIVGACDSDAYAVKPLSELLPESFGPEYLL